MSITPIRNRDSKAFLSPVWTGDTEVAVLEVGARAASDLYIDFLTHLIITHCPRCWTKRRTGYIYPMRGSGISVCSNCRSYHEE